MVFGRRRSLLVWIIGFSSLLTFASGATLLPDDEVDALRQIGKTLGKEWDFNADPCSNKSGWVSTKPEEEFENNVACDCSSENNTCHVVSIVLKGQSLPGSLPPELARLPYLRQIDLTRNYLNGTIPPEWGTMEKLENISLLGNRLSGPIPIELTNITSLRELVIENNYLSGVLPPELENLVNITRMLFSSNNFTGQLPETLANLTQLKDFRISDNHFTGKIPNWIQNWTKLDKLAMQASGLEGPIPSGIFLMESPTDMRISDLKGTGTSFIPPSSNMKKMKTLILRGCNIVGEVRSYLWEITSLKTLDLSFNKLTGTIPSSFQSLPKVDYIYLTGNLLSGRVPDSIKNGVDIDLSYNNFTLGRLGQTACQQGNVNLFQSSSLGRNSSGVDPCLASFRCPKRKIGAGGFQYSRSSRWSWQGIHKNNSCSWCSKWHLRNPLLLGWERDNSNPF